MNEWKISLRSRRSISDESDGVSIGVRKKRKVIEIRLVTFVWVGVGNWSCDLNVSINYLFYDASRSHDQLPTPACMKVTRRSISHSDISFSHSDWYSVGFIRVWYRKPRLWKNIHNTVWNFELVIKIPNVVIWWNP